jgi:glycosyltransferase involved in cell wall biosynthesis
LSKKVLYLCPNAYLGGAERFVLDAIQGHKEYGTWQPHLLFFGQSGNALEEAKINKLPCSNLKTTFRLSNPFTLFKAVLEMRRFIKENDFNIYHATMPYAHIVGALATLGLPIKKTWFQHGPVAGTLDTIASFFYVNHLFFNSQSTKNQHKSSLLVREQDSSSLVPLGIKKRELCQMTLQKLKSTQVDRQITLLSAGRICSWKGHERAIQALAYLSEENPQTIYKLWIVGDIGRDTDQAYKDSLIKLVEELNLQESVIFHGHQQELPTYFRCCDLFLHTSLIPEPFGLVVAEAMINQCFVIGSNMGGVCDILMHQKTGLSFDPIAPNASILLCRQIITALKLREQRLDQFNVIKQQAYDHITTNYNIKNMTNLLEQTYDELTYD